MPILAMRMKLLPIPLPFTTDEPTTKLIPLRSPNEQANTTKTSTVFSFSVLHTWDDESCCAFLLDVMVHMVQLGSNKSK